MKTRKFVLSILIIFGTLGPAFANPNKEMQNRLYENETYESKSHYQTLGDLFENGTTPIIEKLTGVAWAGRCFFKRKPNTPTNAGYIFRNTAGQSDVGPIGRGSTSYEVGSYWKRSEAPNYFDTMSIAEVYADTSLKFTFLPVRSSEDGILTNLERTNISVLKVSGDYLVEEISSRKGEDVGPLGNAEYETGVRCYYFIPEYN